LRKDVLSTADIDDSHRNQLFVLSCIALVASGFVFTMGSAVALDMIHYFNMSATATGLGLGAWSLAFAIAVFVGSPLCDYLGMSKLLALAALCHIVGIVLVILSPQLATSLGGPAFVLYWSWFIAGLGSGLVEAVINPLIATLYPNNKTHKLNVLHAWWPGGLVSSGIVAYFIQASKVGGDNNWKICLAVALIPAAIYFFMTFGQKFPATERVQANVSTNDMVKEAFKPLFIVWFLCMFGTAALELAPGRWVPAMLSNTVHFQGILLTSYVAFIMFLFRFFAGSISHRFSPVGLMWISSILAGIGLFMLSKANSPITGLLAATIWAAGVCFMWPTMLGVASERFPRGGALLIGLMGTAGQVSIQIFVPIMGRIYDDTLKAALDAGQSQPAAEAAAGPVAFERMALIAVVLFVVFGAIWLRDKAAGGYKAEQIIADPSKA
jgi:MFS family permease